jgi:hypothetical protein
MDKIIFGKEFKMRKKIFLIIAFNLFIGAFCFAQSTEAQVRALQGEWLVIRAQIGNEIFEFAQPPFAGVAELVWIFQGNNVVQLAKNLEDNTSQVASSGTFIIASGNIIVSEGGKSESLSFTLQNNNLTLRSMEGTFTLRKR